MAKQTDGFEVATIPAATLKDALLVPEFWGGDQSQALYDAFNAASRKHGHKETILAVAATSLRLAQARALERAPVSVRSASAAPNSDSNGLLMAKAIVLQSALDAETPEMRAFAERIADTITGAAYDLVPGAAS